MRTGCGFGTMTFPGLSNVLRLLAFEEAESFQGADRVAQIAFEIDDQTPEDLAIALDRLRAHPSVLDVLQAPAFGKKGRLIAQVRILAQPDDLESVFETCFSETTTLGLRWQVVERRVLTRDQATVQLDGRSIRVKRAQRSGAVTAKAESGDLLTLKGGRREREAVRKAAEEAGLNSEEDE